MLETKMKTADDLHKLYKKETGEEIENSQGEPDIDYVRWLEEKVIFLLKDKDADSPIEKNVNQAQYSLNDQLKELYELANKNGLYDAADFLKNHIK